MCRRNRGAALFLSLPPPPCSKLRIRSRPKTRTFACRAMPRDQVTPQSVPPVGDAHATTASAQPPPRNYPPTPRRNFATGRGSTPPSPRRNFATGRGVTPPSPRRPATAAASTPTAPRRRLGATAEAILGAMAQVISTFTEQLWASLAWTLTGVGCSPVAFPIVCRIGDVAALFWGGCLNEFRAT